MVASQKMESRHLYSCPTHGRTIHMVLIIKPQADEKYPSPSQLFCENLFPITERRARNYVINSIKLETVINFYVEMSCRTGFFANSYFSNTIKEWKNLSLEI